MKILLPPSEGKADAPSRGRALALGALSFPELHDARLQVLDATVRLCQGSQTRAMKALGLTPGLSDAILTNAQLRKSATLPARELYTGVLYDALSLTELPATARKRADSSLLIFSALFGVLRPSDSIPPYRLSPSAKVPGLPSLATHWRAPLSEALTRECADELVLDLRSGPYAAMWRPRGEIAERTVTMRVLHETAPGKRQVVSHFNKATKGRIVAGLLRRALPTSTDALITALAAAGWTVEPDNTGRCLDVIVSQL